MAVSIDLITFYNCLFERSCDAITAVASALHSVYTRRGYRIKNKEVGLDYILGHIDLL